MRHLLIAGLLAVTLSGCASIMNGSTQPISIRSVPEGASVSVTNRAGEKIHSGLTPVTLTLKRGAGYFKSESYKVVVTKEGFSDRELTLNSNVNGWYIANIVFGGLIGMVGVDPATGAMYSFPESVTATLDASQEKVAGAAPLTIVSTTELSPEVMKHAKLISAP
ncbi:PEGA domain-containing protein [Pseudoduganella sp. SL102]|uniref:PEGA domain-containing protein n=1 Tax=Pseudoduganella albidiflava TaxID=321983 RepID=A0A411X2Y2_9BURK|nr:MULTISPECIES: PEGA domain-containing protein [Pseudoduganella]QBI03215.1 PEGA domain-containing protein [Pseudoduganella albidiflava]WBS04255.1 PEGA domain-containing protein [Pseudoduganella sp. SL102]GGY64282.1 hypothetical protein GCM10007387_53310 [Pseudoduganella albidiflava]